MSIKHDLIIDTVKTVTESIPSGIRSIRNTFSKKLTPDEQAEFDREMAAIEERLTTAQTEINKVEAGSSRLFVSGARPMILWVCAIALAFNYLVAPILRTFNLPVPEIGINELYPLMLGMLGLGAARTYEKIRGVQDKH